ncbi:MAG: Bug family tripartite tricarboxylate transporter substrate binding protein [Lautropia sp.]
MYRRTFLAMALPAGATGVFAPALPLARAAGTAAWPDRAVRLVVSYAAGNVTDLLARIIAADLQVRWQQSVIVENRPGQGGSIGAQLASKAAPDGFTLLFSAVAALAINPHLYARVGYDPLRGFEPIVAVARPQGMIYANIDLPARNFAELLAYSRMRRGELNYGSAGSGTVPHLNAELLKKATGLDATHVPYKAAVAVLSDVIGGRIHFAQESTAVVLPQVLAGKIRPIAAASAGRIAQLPDVPAIGELVPGFDPVTPWLGVLAPAGTPGVLVEKIHRDIAAAMAEPDVRERFAASGLDAMSTTPEQFAMLIFKDHQRLGRLVAELGLKVD